jgi:hypothetical protein
MKNRLSRLLKVLESFPRSGAPDVDAIALELGTTPAIIRRDLRDLRDAGAFGPPPVLPIPESVLPRPAPRAEDELVAMHLGASVLARLGTAAEAKNAFELMERIERGASPRVLDRLRDLDQRFPADDPT